SGFSDAARQPDDFAKLRAELLRAAQQRGKINRGAGAVRRRQLKAVTDPSAARTKQFINKVLKQQTIQFETGRKNETHHYHNQFSHSHRRSPEPAGTRSGSSGTPSKDSRRGCGHWQKGRSAFHHSGQSR